MNITEPIRRNASLTPGSPAIVNPEGEIVSYGGLDRSIDAVAASLLELGIVAGDVAAVSMGSAYRHLVLALALARIGAAAAPSKLSRRRTSACLVEDDRPSNGADRSFVVPRRGFERTSAADDARPLPLHPGGAAICACFSSSGTTGIPKYVAVSHDLVRHRIDLGHFQTPLPEATRLICSIPTTSVFGHWAALRVLWAGGLVIMVRDVEGIVAAIERHRANYLVLSPFVLERVLAIRGHAAKPLPWPTMVEVGGSYLSAPLYRLAAQSLSPDIFGHYGSTEAGPIAVAPAAELVDRPGAVGVVLPGVEMEAVDEHDVPLAPGTEGILRVRGNALVSGYMGIPERSADTFKHGWFYPGDVGKVTADRLLVVVGRSGDLINVGGGKVSPQTVEDVLLTIDGVRDAAAFGLPDALGVVRMWAAIVSDAPMDAASIESACRSRLGALRPQHVLLVKDIPRTETGKILRRELMALASAQVADAAPR
jgi:acyl-coenzyme A synthetase/AMP-(fatty) acid ligase